MQNCFFKTMAGCTAMVFLPLAAAEFNNGQTVITSIPEVTSLEIRTENQNLLHLVAESPQSASKLTIRPGIFPVRKGGRYFVDFVNAVPYEVTAEKDGELTVEFPQRYRADMIISLSKGSNLLKDGGFEKAKLDWKGGKAGAMARSGKQSLQLTLNKFGATVSASSPKIPLEAGKNYMFTVFYRQQRTRNDTMFGSYIYLYRDGQRTPSLAAADYEYNNFPKNIDAETAWQFSRLKVNIPADWKNSRVSAKVVFRISGHPGTVFFDDADLRIAPPSVALAGKEVKVKPAMDEKQLLAFFASHPGYQAKIVRDHHAPAISVNGRIVPPVPLCSWNSALAATAKQQGIEIIMLDIPVNCWGLTRRSVWQGKKRFDMSLVDKALRDVLQYYPEAKVIVKLGGAYNNFCDDVPNSKWVTRDGKNTYVRNTSPKIGQAFSLISDEVRRECADAYRRIAEHIAASPYGKAVIGCKFTMGGDGQWYPAIMPWNFKHFDYSEGSRLSVCSRIRQMYSNDLAALRKAWGDNTITFESIRLPSAGEYDIADQSRLLDPENPRHRRLIDCALAYHREILKSIETFCAAFKEGMGKEVITGTYYTSNSGLCHEELGSSDKIDFFATLGAYMRPRNLGGFSTAALPLESIRLHDKLFFEELDFRNDYSNPVDYYYRRWLGVPFDASPEHAFSQLRRAFGALMTQGQSGWFMTMGQRCHFTWFGPYAPIMKEAVEAFRLNRSPVNDRWPGMIVFHDEKRILYYTTRNNFDHNSGYLSRFYPADSGVAVQHCYLSDLTNPRRPKSKLYIFADAVKFTEEQLQYIEKNLQKDGNVLVFFNDAGALSPGGFEKNIRRLTGMSIRLRPEITVGPMISGEKGCRFTSTLPVYPLYSAALQGPLHFIDDPKAAVLARYLTNPEFPAGAMKKHANWTAVYFGNFPELALNSNTTRELALYAGLKPFAPLGDVSAAGNGIMMLHARYAGEKTLQWQEKCDLVDLETGKTVAGNAAEYTFRMKAGETRWFKQTAH